MISLWPSATQSTSARLKASGSVVFTSHACARTTVSMPEPGVSAAGRAASGKIGQ
jgi:hypothetical protein